MKCNVGTEDRLARGLVGIILATGGLMVDAALYRWLMVSVGAVLIFTAAFAWCPLYFFAGRSTGNKAT